jgi:hypothetical protein
MTENIAAMVIYLFNICLSATAGLASIQTQPSLINRFICSLLVGSTEQRLDTDFSDLFVRGGHLLTNLFVNREDLVEPKMKHLVAL